MPESERQSRSPDDDSLPVEAPGILERLGALLLGLGSGGAGGYAVFTTSNQAGAAALVLAGAAFTLIGVQGTRLVKLGGGGSSIEMANHRAAAKILQRASQESDPEIAEGMAEAAATISPTTASSPMNEAHKYEENLYDALRRISPVVQRDVAVDGGRIDFLAETAGGKRVLVEAKHVSLGRPLARKDVEAAAGRAAAYADDLGTEAGILVVTNAPLSGAVADLNATVRSGRPVVEAVSWNDEQDDNLLTRALVRVAR